MIVSERSGFVFVHNPKCGGTVFRRAIEAEHDHPETFWHPRTTAYFGITLDYAHLRLWEVQALHPDVFDRLGRSRTMVFVRNPLDRFVSALYHHFRAYRPFVGIDALAGRERLSLFRRFARDELSVSRILTDYRYVHFSPQSWFCRLGTRQVVGTVIPMGAGLNPMAVACDELGLDIPGEEWHEPGDDRADVIADALLRHIASRLYAEDWAFLGSMPHLHAIL